SFVYGGFSCLPMILDNKNVIDFCGNGAFANSAKKTNGNKVNYLIYENIQGVKMSEYVKTCHKDNFINIFLQVCFALYFGEQKIQFTHFDLNTDNVIIRDVLKTSPNEKYQIRYFFDKNNDIYLPCENVAMFIDYEFAHIGIKDKSGVTRH